jgi:hypothetical protein
MKKIKIKYKKKDIKIVSTKCKFISKNIYIIKNILSKYISDF